MKRFMVFLLVACSIHALADLPYQPLRISACLDKPTYSEGETIRVAITLKNTGPNPYPLFLPKNGTSATQIFKIEIFDGAQNCLLSRMTSQSPEELPIKDDGFELIFLNQMDSVNFTILINPNVEDYQAVSPIWPLALDAPLFAGKYRFVLSYQIALIPGAEDYFHFYNDFKASSALQEHLFPFPLSGLTSTLLPIDVIRSNESLVRIEEQDLFMLHDGHRYWYFSEPMDEIISDQRLIHVTNIPPGKSSCANEYYYSQFPGTYAEYIRRFDDGDIQEYRKYKGDCPEYIRTEKFNEQKQRIYTAYRLSNGHYYWASYAQPEGRIRQEAHIDPFGKIGELHTFYYHLDGSIKNIDQNSFDPCPSELELRNIEENK